MGNLRVTKLGHPGDRAFRFLARAALLLAIAAAAGCAAPRSVAPVTAPAIAPVGDLALTARFVDVRFVANDLIVDSTRVGGLSGIDWLGGNEWVLISDDRSRTAPARFYRATMAVTDTGIAELTIRSAHMLRRADGRPFRPATEPRSSAKDPDDIVVDPEAIRVYPQASPDPLTVDDYRAAGLPVIADPQAYLADPSTVTVYWTSEGDRELGLPPEIRSMSLDGTFRRAYALDSIFSIADPDRGPRNNGTFEALALSPYGGVYGSCLIVALEQPLLEDGPAASPDLAGPVRISWIHTHYGNGRVLRQFAYVPELAPEPAKPGGATDNGVVEILAYDADRLLVLERAWAEGVGNTVRLFLADVSDATDLTDLKRPPSEPDRAPHALAGIVPARKQLVLDFATLGLPRLDNIEGMSWGPHLCAGRTLVFVSDNNFNPQQVTELVVVAIEATHEARVSE